MHEEKTQPFVSKQQQQRIIHHYWRRRFVEVTTFLPPAKTLSSL